MAEGWSAILDSQLPAPGCAELPRPLITQAGANYNVGYDLLGLTYWMLSRQEEIGSRRLDNHGRFPATASHAYQHGYLERPLVDEWLHILGQVIQRTWPNIPLRQHQFALRVSHDVDQPSLYAFKSWPAIARMMAGHALKRRDLNALITAPYVKIATKTQLIPADPYHTFDWLMDHSEAHQLKSAFYFICGRTHPAQDADYEPEHPVIRHLMRRIHARGHEIGLHPSYHTCQHPERIAQEANRLRKICAEEGIEQPLWGGRMHYLRWEQPTTLYGWEQAGMHYDSTLGYADQAGFRCGTCFEYPAFDPIRQAVLKLRIRPLIAMECSVIDAAYMGLGQTQAAVDQFIQLKNKCKAVKGNFVLLWHNSRLQSEAEKNIYQQVLT